MIIIIVYNNFFIFNVEKLNNDFIGYLDMNKINENQTTTSNYGSTKEHLFVFAMRNWLEGNPVSSKSNQRLISLFSLHYIDYATKAFDGLMRTINQNSRNVFYLHREQCVQISNDEMAIVNLIAFIQAHDYQNAESLVSDITTLGGQNDLMDAASILAQILEVQNIIFNKCGNARLSLMPVLGTA